MRHLDPQLHANLLHYRTGTMSSICKSKQQAEEHPGSECDSQAQQQTSPCEADSPTAPLHNTICRSS